MTLPHNIDKSAFRRGQYVGYSGTLVWRIEKSNSSFGRWFARNDSSDLRTAATFLYGWTLDEIANKLASFEHRAA
jgi:hypothetical protein